MRARSVSESDRRSAESVPPVAWKVPFPRVRSWSLFRRDSLGDSATDDRPTLTSAPGMCSTSAVADGTCSCSPAPSSAASKSGSNAVALMERIRPAPLFEVARGAAFSHSRRSDVSHVLDLRLLSVGSPTLEWPRGVLAPSSAAASSSFARVAADCGAGC